MANKEHLSLLKKGVYIWNEWRKGHLSEIPDLAGAVLERANLSQANLSDANLFHADLTRADLFSADLKDANLRSADLDFADLRSARLSNADLGGASLMNAILKNANLRNANLALAKLYYADLSNADLNNADLTNTNLTDADLSNAGISNANLERASLIRTNLNRADLSNCSIYGISAWDVKLVETIQKDLIITHEKWPFITVDNLEVAQFIYLLLHNEKIRDIIDTITSKIVLILGRFTQKRKVILDSIKEELRKRNYLPVLFDFRGPTSRDSTEIISTLAHMARFIIADVTDARSIPQELQAIVPNLPSLPVQPLLQRSKKEYGMFAHLKKYPWVLALHRYGDLDDLMATLKEKVISPAEAKLFEVRGK